MRRLGWLRLKVNAVHRATWAMREEGEGEEEGCQRLSPGLMDFRGTLHKLVYAAGETRALRYLQW